MSTLLQPSDALLPQGLVFTSDSMPGYRRLKRGRGFSFRYPDGTLLTSKPERKRILSLAIPPAYEDVWICMKANGHLQATGMDARLRKQYRYHPHWHEHAANLKFGVLPDFAKTLPKLRARYRKSLKNQSLDKDRIVAGIVCLLDQTGYRIGNARYEKENRSYGLSSLLSKHAKESEDGSVILSFRGKSGQQHLTEIQDARLVKLVEDLHELPGQHLFRYEDDSGQLHDIDSSDVNDWLKATTGGDFTAKQLRTWKATVLCARALKNAPCGTTQAEIKRAINLAIASTAKQLNHTKATCRKYYIHPALLERYMDGFLHHIMNAPAPRLRKADGSAGLHADERRVLKIITSVK
ncbi:DNA topoisomerase IB [Luteolibacter algae]|uniref:DNA topoisomerase n=1 Tax=Luteolibacter algae TaxID=454151 RepID=A0ABW5D8Q5_9BACT